MTLTDSELEHALAELDAATMTHLHTAIRSPDFNGQIGALTLKDLASLLPLATAFSVHPISGIAVGAVAVGQSGQLYLGANLEFIGMPLHATLHAEQSAVLNAWMHDEKAVVSLYVSKMPCGHCRQFLRELTNIKSVPIHAHGKSHRLEALLPYAFGETRPQGHGLLDSRPFSLDAAQGLPNILERRAINAAQRSYTPYSQSPEGFTLECLDGRVFSGRAAECAAFNPSVPSVLVALNQRNLSFSRKVTITHATQAKLATSTNNPLAFARAIIRTLSKAPVKVVQMEAK